MATTQQIGLTATLDISQFQSSAAAYMRTLQQMQTAAASTQTGIATSFNGIGRMDGSVTSSLDNIGKGFIAIGAAATAAAVGGVALLSAESIKMAANFEQSLADIASRMRETIDGIAPLRDTIFNLAIDPNLKVSLVEAGDAALMLASAGITMQEQMGGALETTVAFQNAVGGNFELAANVAISAMDAFGLKSDQLDAAVDGATGAINRSKLDLQKYAYVITNAGVSFAGFGGTLSQLNTVAAATASMFVSGQKQGTGMAEMMNRMAVPTDKAKKRMAELGVTFWDNEGKAKDLFNIVDELRVKLAQLSPKEQRTAMVNIFGKQGGPAMTALLRMTGDELRTLEKEVNASGQAATSAATRMDTLTGAYGTFQDILVATGTSMAGGFVPILKTALQSINASLLPIIQGFDAFGLSGAASIMGLSASAIKSAEGIDKAFAGISESLMNGNFSGALAQMGLSIDTVAIAFYGLTGAAGGLLILGTVAATIFTVSAAFAALVSPVGILITTVAILGAAWNLNMGGIKDSTYQAINIAIGLFNQFVDISSKLMAKFSAEVSRQFAVLQSDIESVFAPWPGIVSNAMKIASMAFRGYISLWPDWMVTVMKSVYDTIVNSMNSAISYFQDGLNSLGSYAGMENINLAISAPMFPDIGKSFTDSLSGIGDMFSFTPAGMPEYLTQIEKVKKATLEAGAAADTSALDFADANSGMINMEGGAKRAGRAVKDMADDVAKAKEKISDNNMSMANLRGEIAQLESQYPGLTQEIVDNFNAHVAAGNSVASFGDKLGATERRQMFNYLTKLIDMNDANKTLIGSNGLIDKSFGTVQDGFMQLVDTMSKGLNIPTTITVAGQEFDYSQFEVVGSLAPEDAAAEGMQDTNTAIDALTPNAATLGDTLNDTVNPALATMGQTADTVANTNLSNLNNVIASNLLPSLGQIFTALSTQVAPALINTGTQSDLLGQAFTRLIEMSDLVTSASKRVFAAMTIESQLVQDLTKYYHELALAKKETVDAGGSTGAAATPSGGDQYAGPGFAGGGSFIVPSGFPSGGYGMPMRVHSGELVKVYTASQTRQLGRTQPSQHITSSSNDNSSKVVNFNITTQQPSRSISSDLAFIKAKYGVML